jgi:hypothetical protein
MPVTQKSAKKGKYFYFHCFRAGMGAVTVKAEDRLRQKTTKKCGCQFLVKYKHSGGLFEVTEIAGEHNHELFTGEELALLPQNRSIPEGVKAFIKPLASLGQFRSNQLDDMVRATFPDVEVTWTRRDLQNHLQSLRGGDEEAAEFIKLLEGGREEDPR